MTTLEILAVLVGISVVVQGVVAVLLYLLERRRSQWDELLDKRELVRRGEEFLDKNVKINPGAVLRLRKWLEGDDDRRR